MTLEERIGELQADGKRQMATELIKGVIGGADSAELEVADETVYVRHPRFTGRHDIRVNDRGEVQVEQRGRYVFTGESNALDIEVRMANSRAVRFAERTVAPEDLRENTPELESDAPNVFADVGVVTFDDADSQAGKYRTAKLVESIRRAMRR